MNFIRLLVVVLTCIAWLAVLLAVVFPSIALVLGLGIDISRFRRVLGKSFLCIHILGFHSSSD
jgi:hypothetical protein